MTTQKQMSRNEIAERLMAALTWADNGCPQACMNSIQQIRDFIMAEAKRAEEASK